MQSKIRSALHLLKYDITLSYIIALLACNRKSRYEE